MMHLGTLERQMNRREEEAGEKETERELPRTEDEMTGAIGEEMKVGGKTIRIEVKEVKERQEVKELIKMKGMTELREVRGMKRVKGLKDLTAVIRGSEVRTRGAKSV